MPIIRQLHKYLARCLPTNFPSRSMYRCDWLCKSPSSFYHNFAYDAANLLLDTVEDVVIQEGDGSLHIGWQALREALYATVDYEGLTGRITCDKFGDCGVLILNIVRLDDPAAGIEGLRENVIFTYTSE